MAEKTRILIIGGTRHLGKFIVEASVEAGNPTFVLIRDSTRFPSAKSQLLTTFKSRGITLLHGDIYDHDSLVMAIKQVDVVISTVSTDLIDDQVKIIAAIKEAGNVKRFIPSDFGTDVDNIEGAIEPAASFFEAKAKIRRAIEAEGIPYTYISCYGFASYFLDTLAQENATSPPRDKVVILSDGNAKAIFNDERDIATYTVRAVDDPKTLNRTLHIRPPANIMSFNEVVSLWERKICKTLEKVHIPEDQVIRNIQESSFPKNFVLALEHAVFVKGIMTSLQKNPSVGVEATERYPDVKYTTLDEYLNQFIQ
ncbi:phenylcoumaran benzylic ether reductase Pyrc5-like isoform X3 [Amaranthus tricolor]|nr:phenylcoumaran benzylic ether reductase Pyrc5-like isoform X2 [Amaranthus tricolor]XP_057515809.1 phenylcoumaran benzylic ether reductase Pyrc5-like isoform X3 [Amaranthus tricolor]